MDALNERLEVIGMQDHKELIRLYVEGKATKDQAADVEALAERHPELDAFLDKVVVEMVDVLAEK